MVRPRKKSKKATTKRPKNKAMDAIIAAAVQEEKDAVVLELEKQESEYGKPTPVEIVSKDEAYIILGQSGFDNAGRIVYVRGRRVCGYQRMGMPEGYRCLQSAGAKTNHFGIGYCSFHDASAAGGAFNLLKGRASKGQALKIEQFYALYPELSDQRSLEQLDDEIIALRGILAEALSGSDTEAVLSIIDQITKAKVAQSKIKIDKLLIDEKSVRYFVSSIMHIVKALLKEHPDLLAVFYERVRNELVFPINQPMQETLKKLKNDPLEIKHEELD